MVEIPRLPEDVLPTREQPNFDVLRQHWQENKADFHYDHKLAGSEFGLPPLAEIERDFESARARIETLFEIRSISDEDGTDTEDDEQSFAVQEKLIPKNADYRRDAILSAIKLVQVSIARLISPLAFLSKIIDGSSEPNESTPDQGTSPSISPLEQTRNEIRSKVVILIECKKQMVMYREASMPLHKILQDGKLASIQRGLRAVRESADVWSETTDLHWEAMNDCVAVAAVIDASKDEMDTEINPVMRQRHEKYLNILMTYSGSVEEILDQENFARDSEEFWRQFRRLEAYDFTLTVFHYFKFLRNKKSGLALLLNHISPRERKIEGIASKKPKETKKEFEAGDIKKVKEFLQNVDDEIQKIAPLIALLAQKDFVKRHRDKWDNLSPEFEQFRDALFPVFEYIQERPKAGGDITHGVLRDKKTGDTYSIARFGGSIPEALKKLGGRLSVPQRTKKK